MIVKQTTWFGLIFSMYGSVFPRIWLRTLLTVGVATLVAVLHHRYGWLETSLTPLPFTLVGLALSIFLGFRNNTSYDRFWEGRKLWGRLVNTTRSLARQILTLVRSDGSAPSDEQRWMVYRVIAYAHCLRLHLRDEHDHGELVAFLDTDELATLPQESNRPYAILHALGERFAGAFRRGDIDAFHVPVFEGSLADLTDIQGGCERIKSTPIPFTYTVLIHRIVAAYCFALPLGITHSVGILTPLVVLLVSYAFFGLDAIGDEIEEPFGKDLNDLPLSALSRTIEVNLRQRLGEAELPSMLEPVDGVLS